MLQAELFNSDKILINGVDMKIKLTRVPDAFYLWRLQTITKYVSDFRRYSFYHSG